MNTVKGTVRGGMVVLDEPNGFAEGQRVEVAPLQADRSDLGMREEDWPTTPEGIAALAQRMREAEPLEITEDEEAAMAEWRRKRKEYELSKWEERCRIIEEGFR